jgi:hypothetical protein
VHFEVKWVEVFFEFHLKTNIFGFEEQGLIWKSDSQGVKEENGYIYRKSRDNEEFELSVVQIL